jgi:hypothetical protein
VVVAKKDPVGLLLEKTRGPHTLSAFLYQKTLVVTLDVVPSEVSCYLGNHESVKTIALVPQIACVVKDQISPMRVASRSGARQREQSGRR